MAKRIPITGEICDADSVVQRARRTLALVVLALLPACGVGRAKPPPPPPQRPLENAGKLQEQTHVHHVPGRTESTTRSVPVTKMVTRYEYQCRMVSKSVMRSETVYEYRYDYATKSSRSVPTTRMVTRYEPQNECRTVPVMKSETQYETKTETRYIPPTSHITKIYSKDTVLIEAESEVLVTPHHRAKR
jgi:membrane-bound lytic murein transglycosylase